MRRPVPRHEVLEQREELGSLIFGAMHQQDPTEIEGSIIKRWWLRRYDFPPEYQDLHSWTISVDCTFKDADTSDYVAIQTSARGPEGNYLIDQYRGRMSFVETVRAIDRMRGTWPKVTRVLVEDKANGPAVISQMQRDTPGMIAFTPRGSKRTASTRSPRSWNPGTSGFPA